MMKMSRYPLPLIALTVCLAVSGCSKNTSQSKNPRFELAIHELTVPQGTTQILGSRYGIVTKVEGQHSGVTVVLGDVIYVTATKDAKEGTYEFVFSDKDGNLDTLKVIVKKADPSSPAKWYELTSQPAGFSVEMPACPEFREPDKKYT
jgi:hypothetical protein